MYILVLCCTLFALAAFSQSARILFLPMHMTGSHKKSMVPLADALANQGHQVTFWNTFFEKMPITPTNKEIIDRDLITNTTNQLYNEQWVWHNGTDIMGSWNSGEIQSWDMLLLFSLSLDICKHAIEQDWDKIEEIINGNFDLMMVDTLFSPCGMLIAERSGTPKILLSTSYTMPFTSRHLSVPKPISNYPAVRINFVPSKFWHRLQIFSIWYVYDIVNTNLAQRMHRYMLKGVWPKRFDWKSFDQSALYSFHSAPVTIYDPNPTVPDLFSYGDIPCAKLPKADLPLEYSKFVEDPASNGTIVAAFGHIVNWKLAPRRDVMQLHQAFGQLKDYRIVWQYNGEPLPHLPNTKFTEWLPQKELLYHPKTKVFLSHMGLKSVMEGLCAEVPFVALPVYAEQPLNARLMIHRHQTGSVLDKKGLQVDDIVTKFKQVLDDPQYKYRISNLRGMLMDRPKNPIEDAAFRINFVLKHQKHADMWRVRGRNLYWFAYYNLDIFFVVTVLGLLVIYVMVKGIKLIL